jgi:hypothetical protein
MPAAEFLPRYSLSVEQVESWNSRSWTSVVEGECVEPGKFRLFRAVRAGPAVPAVQPSAPLVEVKISFNGDLVPFAVPVGTALRAVPFLFQDEYRDFFAWDTPYVELRDGAEWVPVSGDEDVARDGAYVLRFVRLPPGKHDVDVRVRGVRARLTPDVNPDVTVLDLIEEIRTSACSAGEEGELSAFLRTLGQFDAFGADWKIIPETTTLTTGTTLRLRERVSGLPVAEAVHVLHISKAGKGDIRFPVAMLVRCATLLSRGTDRENLILNMPLTLIHKVNERAQSELDRLELEERSLCAEIPAADARVAELADGAAADRDALAAKIKDVQRRWSEIRLKTAREVLQELARAYNIPLDLLGEDSDVQVVSSWSDVVRIVSSKCGRVFVLDVEHCDHEDNFSVIVDGVSTPVGLFARYVTDLALSLVCEDGAPVKIVCRCDNCFGQCLAELVRSSGARSGIEAWVSASCPRREAGMNMRSRAVTLFPGTLYEVPLNESVMTNYALASNWALRRLPPGATTGDLSDEIHRNVLSEFEAGTEAVLREFSDGVDIPLNGLFGVRVPEEGERHIALLHDVTLLHLGAEARAAERRLARVYETLRPLAPPSTLPASPSTAPVLTPPGTPSSTPAADPAPTPTAAPAADPAPLAPVNAAGPHNGAAFPAMCVMLERLRSRLDGATPAEVIVAAVASDSPFAPGAGLVASGFSGHFAWGPGEHECLDPVFSYILEKGVSADEAEVAFTMGDPRAELRRGDWEEDAIAASRLLNPYELMCSARELVRRRRRLAR